MSLATSLVTVQCATSGIANKTGSVCQTEATVRTCRHRDHIGSATLSVQKPLVKRRNHTRADRRQHWGGYVGIQKSMCMLPSRKFSMVSTVNIVNTPIKDTCWWCGKGRYGCAQRVVLVSILTQHTPKQSPNKFGYFLQKSPGCQTIIVRKYDWYMKLWSTIPSKTIFQTFKCCNLWLRISYTPVFDNGAQLWKNDWQKRLPVAEDRHHIARHDHDWPLTDYGPIGHVRNNWDPREHHHTSYPEATQYNASYE